MKKIKTCKSAGFCFGVDRAVNIALEQGTNHKNVFTLGDIIHNTQVVDKLKEKNIFSIEDITKLPKDSKLIIRSHGVSEEIINQLKENNIEYIDATCPFVSKIHKTVKENCTQDRVLLLAGNFDHPEVQGILGYWQGEYFTFKNSGELDEILLKLEENSIKDVILVAQTTFIIEEWEKSKKKVKKVYTNALIFDTICSATVKRQQEAEMLAQESDIMIIVGGKHSSNTAKLKNISEKYCKTIHIEQSDELDYKDFFGAKNIGITAGASTPAWIIKEVQDNMSEFLKENEEELSFEEMLNLSFKSTYNGEKITGVVTSIAPNEIAVDIGTKHAGYVPLHELTDDPTAKIEDLVKKGDEIELLVVRVNDVEGTVMLSKKRLDAIAGFEKVMDAAGTEEILEGIVIEAVKGGVLAVTNGVKVFIPISQISLNRVEDLTPYLKKSVSFKILEVNRQRRRAVGSVKAVLKDQRKILEDQFWTEVEVGKIYTGVVKSITDFGAFVDLGGVDGMVHISELSWTKIKHPSQVVKLGDSLEVFVKDIDAEKRKISLGFKKNEDNPWAILSTKYAVGDIAKVKIVSLTAFGAFAQIIPGVDGLIHISQISLERINKPADVLAVGQEVDAKITEIDLNTKRISLSIKAILEAEQAETEQAEVEQATQEVSETTEAE